MTLKLLLVLTTVFKINLKKLILRIFEKKIISVGSEKFETNRLKNNKILMAFVNTTYKWSVNKRNSIWPAGDRRIIIYVIFTPTPVFPILKIEHERYFKVYEICYECDLKILSMMFKKYLCLIIFVCRVRNYKLFKISWPMDSSFLNS